MERGRAATRRWRASVLSVDSGRGSNAGTDPAVVGALPATGDSVTVREHLWLPEFGSVDSTHPYSAVGEYPNEPESVSELDLTLGYFTYFPSR